MKHLLHLKMLLLALLIFPATMVAQQGRVTGTITEASSKSPLPGANIIVKAPLMVLFLILMGILV